MGSTGGGKRIQKELQECTTHPPPHMRIHLPDETNIYKWEVLIEGPPSTPYASGHFRLQITLPTEYPFKPPLLNFATKIYHPNVSNDEKGAMCLGMLRSDQWKPPNKIRAVLEMLGQLMGEPDCDDAVETAVADQYKNHRKEFDKTARDWVKRYASKKQ